MKVAVTGGEGFIGRHLVKYLEGFGHDVLVIDLKHKKTFDIRNLDPLKKILSGVDTVFHLAALPSVQFSIDHPKESHDTNVDGTLNVLLAARESGVRRVVFSSSSAVYGDTEKLPIAEDAPLHPKSPYALHKHMGELLCRLWSEIYEIETVSLRYFNVYGEGMNPEGPYASVVGVFSKQKAAGGPLTITGDGTQTRDFVHVSDVVRANVLALESKSVGSGEALNIGSGEGISVNELASIVGGSTKNIEPRVEPKDSLADNRKAKEILGWIPSIGIEKGLQELLDKS